jgi:hypothetical protein
MKPALEVLEFPLLSCWKQSAVGDGEGFGTERILSVTFH